MHKRFMALIVFGLATILVPISAHAGGLAFDAAGNLFEASGNAIFKFTPDGTRSTFATGFKNASNLIFDSKGDLFASDDGQKSILKITPDGKKSTFASGMRRPEFLTFDNMGNLFVSDEGHSIFKFTPDGKKSTFATGLEPSGMAFDDKGNLFVADAHSHSIFKFTPDGTRSTFATVFTVGGLGFRTNSLVFDRSGNLFVVDVSIHSMFKFATDGAKSTFATGIFGDDGPVIDGSGNLVVPIFDSNTVSRAISKFTPDGIESTFASGLNPNALVFDGAGNLFVSDGGSIFKFTPDGTRSSFAVDVSWISPDKKWQYTNGDQPKIVKAGTNEMAGDLSDVCGIGSCGEGAAVLWAPDSKRFAFNWGQGRSHNTSLYQLHGEEWKALKSPDDEVFAVADKIIAAQLKRKGLSEKKLSKEKMYLRLIWWTPKVRRWVDSNTAILYASLQQVTALRDSPGEMFDHFGADVLFTLKFDDAGNCKIVKTHRMSKNEVEEEQ